MELNTNILLGCYVGNDIVVPYVNHGSPFHFQLIPGDYGDITDSWHTKDWVHLGNLNVCKIADSQHDYCIFSIIELIQQMH